MSAAEERRARKRYARELARELRNKDRERLKLLKAKLREARDAKRRRVADLRALCKAEKLRLRAKARRLAAELRRTRAALRARRGSCSTEITAARVEGVQTIGEARAAYEGERDEQKRTRSIERAWKGKGSKLSGVERQAESDDEVRGNLPGELVPVFERVKRGIRATDRTTRTEVFLDWVHRNSATVERLMNEEHERGMKALEAEERALRRESRKASRYSPSRGPDKLAADLADIPF